MEAMENLRATPLRQNGRMMKLIEKPEHGSLPWHMGRWRTPENLCAFGASDAPALMGESPYKTRAELFVEKVKMPKVTEETDRMRVGNWLEPTLIDVAAHDLQVPLLTPKYQYWKDRWVISCDGVDDAEKPTLVVECKTTAKYQVETLADLPPEWRWQGWVQSMVTGAPVIFSVLDRRQVFRLIELPPSSRAFDALAEESEKLGAMVDSGSGLEDLIDELGYEEIAELYDSPNGIVELPSEADVVLEALVEAREAKAAAEEREKAAKDALARMLKDGDTGVRDGMTVVTWKLSKGRESLDQAALKAAHPELVKEFMKQGSGFRTMRLVGRGKGE